MHALVAGFRRPPRSRALWLAALPLAFVVTQACGLDETGRGEAGDGGRDAPVDGGRAMPEDAGPVIEDAGPVIEDAGRDCVPETCNGIDDDCDDMVDEGFDLESDVQNCGGCGRPCPELPHSAPTCIAGVCDLTCDPGFADCDEAQATGCEASLGDATSCGRCRRTCSNLCVQSFLGAVCAAFCPGSAVPCGTTCTDTATAVLHCGGCDMECAQRPHARPECEGSACGNVCDRGFVDCDGSEETGCETPCPRAHASVTCEGGSCRVGSCDSGWADCDGIDGTGCETQLGTVSDCRGCGDACPARPHAVPDCGLLGCGFRCDAGWGNCDASLPNGCETALDTSASCGACIASCGPGETCTGGACACGAMVGRVGAGAVCDSSTPCCPRSGICGC